MHPLVIGGVVVIGVVVIATVGWELYERYGEQRGYQYEHPYLRTESPVPRFEEERHEDDDDQDEKDPEGKLRRRHNRGVAMKEFYHEDMLASAGLDAGAGSEVIFDRDAMKHPPSFQDQPQFMDIKDLDQYRQEGGRQSLMDAVNQESDQESRPATPVVYAPRSRSSTTSSFAEINAESANTAEVEMTDDETTNESMYESAASAADTPNTAARSRSTTLRSNSDSDEDWEAARSHPHA